MIRIKSDKIILSDRIVAGYVYIDQGKITEVSANELPVEKTYDLTGKYVSAGFIDMHVHGAMGYSFLTAEPDEIITACEYHMTHGTTTICPTLSTAPIGELEAAVEKIGRAMENTEKKVNIAGAHLEGPYFNPEQCGAQDTSFITPPVKEDYERVIKNLGKYIKRWSYAPENDKDAEFCRALVKAGIVPAAGHTGALYDEMMLAKDNGCKLVTHLYSCTSTITRDKGFRRLGVTEATYLHDDIDAEIIADGKHLPPELIRMILKIKGTEKIAMITDSLEVCGAEERCEEISGGRFIVMDGVCRLLPDMLCFAGSIATTDRLLNVAVKSVGVSICEAVRMLTENPARMMNLYSKGSLKCGYDADITVFDEDLNVTDVFVCGNKTK